MRKLRILIIENDEDEQYFIRKGFLSTNLFEIIEILFNASVVIKNLKDNVYGQPDLILSDLNMHGMNGFELLAALKRDPQLSTIPVVITSNATPPVVVEKCKQLGAFAHKEKPEDFNRYDVFAESLYRQLIEKTEDAEG